jgi:hypothetical protein
MRRSSDVEIGQSFSAVGLGLVWRVEKRLADGVHVVIVCEDDPSRRKTISVWGLLDTGQFQLADGRPKA